MSGLAETLNKGAILDYYKINPQTLPSMKAKAEALDNLGVSVESLHLMKKKAEAFDLLEKEGTLQSLPSYKLMAEAMNSENITLNMLPEISKKVKNYEIIKHHYLKYYIHFFDRIKEYTSLKVEHKPTNIISVINEYCKDVPDDNTCVYYQTEGWWVDV